MQPLINLRRPSTILDTGFNNDYIKAKEIGIILAKKDIQNNSVINDFSIFKSPDFLDGLEDGYNSEVIDHREKLILKTRCISSSSIHIYKKVCSNLITNIDTLNKLREETKAQSTCVNISNAPPTNRFGSASIENTRQTFDKDSSSSSSSSSSEHFHFKPFETDLTSSSSSEHFHFKPFETDLTSSSWFSEISSKRRKQSLPVKNNTCDLKDKSNVNNEPDNFTTPITMKRKTRNRNI